MLTSMICRQIWSTGRCLFSKQPSRFPGTSSRMLTSFNRTVTKIGDMTLEMEAGKLATLADGSITIRAGDTVVLVSVVSPRNSSGETTNLKSEDNFVPLTVEYREKSAAFGRIPMSYHRKETITEREILVSRSIDRSIRPLFPKGFGDETQVMATVLSTDRRYDPDILSINGASIALGLSDIPWNGPIGAVRVGFINNDFVSNLPYSKVSRR
jgi:polyribonucleotide nucleotidyltransferase